MTTKKELRDEILRKLQEMAPVRNPKTGWISSPSGDPASDHPEADDLLLELIGDPDISAAFNAIEKWYA